MNAEQRALIVRHIGACVALISQAERFALLNYAALRDAKQDALRWAIDTPELDQHIVNRWQQVETLMALRDSAIKNLQAMTPPKPVIVKFDWPR